jgi:hypothetical protein
MNPGNGGTSVISGCMPHAQAQSRMQHNLSLVAHEPAHAWTAPETIMVGVRNRTLTLIEREDDTRS